MPEISHPKMTIDQIKQHEALRLKVYDDATGLLIGPGSRVVGHPTIGYGRCLDTNGITQHEAEDLFEHDVSRAECGLDSKIPWWRELSENRQTALREMAFNLGIDGLLGFRKMLSALKAADYDTAATEAIDSKWAGQVGRRARVIADQLRYG